MAVVIAACGTASNILAPTETDLQKVKADFPDATAADLQQGFTLFKSNCSGCHILHLPAEKTKQQWAKLLPEMFVRTQLKAEEKILITKYLFAKSN